MTESNNYLRGRDPNVEDVFVNGKVGRLKNCRSREHSLQPSLGLTIVYRRIVEAANAG